MVLSGSLTKKLMKEMWANCDTCENEGEIVVEKYNII